MVQQEYGEQRLFAPRRLFSGRLGLVVGALLAVVLLFFLVNAIGSCAGGVRGPAKWTVNVGQTIDYQLNSEDIASIPGSSEVTTVSLSSQDDGFSLGDDQMASIKDALYKVEKSAHCGFVFVDLSTGRGLAYNTEEVMYCASAVKAALSYYITSNADSSGDGMSDSTHSQIENTIQWSSNSDYFSLCDKYFDNAYVAWLSTFGVSYNEDADGNFPSMNARSLAAIWSQIYPYIQSNSESGKWLSNLFASTETSYIREGLADTGATVRDKAGWISDGETDAVTDAGIVTVGNRDYLMVIITGQRDTEKGHRNVSELAKVLYDARGQLAPEISLSLG